MEDGADAVALGQRKAFGPPQANEESEFLHLGNNSCFLFFLVAVAIVTEHAFL